MASLLRLAAIAASALVALSFVLFALDEADKGSQQQVSVVEGSETQKATGEEEHGGLRRSIDDANDFLVTPFADIVNSDDTWVEHLVPAALALFLYGFGGLMLANWLPDGRREPGDWREAT